MVRCAHCSHRWFVQAAELAEASAGGARLAGDTRFDESRFEEPRRDDSRFDTGAQSDHREPGYDPTPPGWADPAAQWSAEATEPGDTVQFAPSDDEIEFAPPSDVEAVDDAPAIAPDDQDGAALANADASPSESRDGEAEPDYFEIQRRRKSRTSADQGKASLLTPPRLAAALAALIALLIFERFNIVRLMPQTASLYAAISMPVNLRGLVFEDVRTVTEMQDAVPVLVIEGVIRNVTRENADVPRLRFAMRNNVGADIYSWTSVPERPQLTPGGVMGFRTRLASPPPESRNAYVRFVQRRDMASTSH